MTLAQFRKALKTSTNFKLSIKSFSFGKQAIFTHIPTGYIYGNITSAPIYEKHSADIIAFKEFINSISLESYKELYKATETNLTASVYKNNELK